MADLYKMSSQRLLERLSKFKVTYKDFVLDNPETVDQIEKSVKAASYLLEAFTADFETSIFLTELVSCAHNLFSYANSRLLLKSKKVLSKQQDNLLVEKIKQVLAVVEFSQAFIEISARKIGGPGARWAVIVLICLVKAILRCLLIFVFKSGIQAPSTSTLIRTSAFISSADDESERESASDQKSEEVYIGNRTGHKMRTLSCSASTSGMSSSQGVQLKKNPLIPLPPTPLTPTEKLGETLHAVRPLLHALTSGVCGTTSFLPWLTGLVIDSSSHVLLHRSPTSSEHTQPQYNEVETVELRRRYLNMLLYLLRTPVYDKYTEAKLMSVLGFLSEKLPLGRFVFEPMQRYIPEWQRVYFYSWTD